MPKVAMLRSNTAGQKIRSSDFRNLPPNWSTVRYLSSWRLGARLLHWRPSLRPHQFRSFSITRPIPCNLGSLRALTSPEGTSQESLPSAPNLRQKRLGLLRGLVPSATSIAVLVNPARPGVDAQLAQIQQAARVLGLPLHILKASSERDLTAIFEKLVELRAGALVVTADGLFADHRDQIVALTKRYLVPTMFQFREFAAIGGLMSYGPQFGQLYRQSGILAGRILRGEKPADLPVIQSNKFELVINMKAAKALGIEVPNSMQLLADEVIE